MKKVLTRPLFIFFAASLFLALLFFLLPINLFEGEVIVKKGLQETVLPRLLSLSYFIGIGYDKADMIVVKDFYLLPKGYFMAGLFIFGFPALAAYRIHLEQKKRS